MELTKTENEFVELYRNITRSDILKSSQIVSGLLDNGTNKPDALRNNLVAIVIRLIYVLNDDNVALATDDEEVYRYDYKNNIWDVLTYNEFQNLVIHTFNLFFSETFKYALTPDIIHDMYELITSFLPLLNFSMSYCVGDNRFIPLRNGVLVNINQSPAEVLLCNISEKDRMYKCPFKYYLDVDIEDISSIDPLDFDNILEGAEEDVDEGYNIVDPFDYLDTDYEWGDDDEYLGDDDDD